MPCFSKVIALGTFTNVTKARNFACQFCHSVPLCGSLYRSGGCGHSVCAECAYGSYDRGEPCPTCKRPSGMHEVPQTQPPHQLGEHAQLEHVHECTWVQLLCPAGCREVVVGALLDEHMKSCPCALLRCPCCGQLVKRHRFKAHLRGCGLKGKHGLLICPKSDCPFVGENIHTVEVHWQNVHSQGAPEPQRVLLPPSEEERQAARKYLCQALGEGWTAAALDKVWRVESNVFAVARCRDSYRELVRTKYMQMFTMNQVPGMAPEGRGTKRALEDDYYGRHFETDSEGEGEEEEGPPHKMLRLL